MMNVVLTCKQDLALATVQAAFVAQAANRRFMVSAGIMPSSAVIAQIIVGRFPELAGRVHAVTSPPHRASLSHPPAGLSDTSLTGAILGIIQYRRVEDTLADVVQQIVELQRRKNWRQIIQS